MMSGMKRRSGGSIRDKLAAHNARVEEAGRMATPSVRTPTAATTGPAPTTISRPIASSARAGIENVNGVGVLNPPRDAVARNMQMQEMETVGALKRRSR